jgi:glutamate/tyrosine decarboxylase-like PLP-dependent enzyme
MMTTINEVDTLPRHPEPSAALDLEPEAFRAIGHELVDRITDLLAGIADRPVAPDTTPAALRTTLGVQPLLETGTDPADLMDIATKLLFYNFTFNGHPRFWGYITASAAPIGILGELLAAAVNPNVGGWSLSPIATEIEAQTVQWIAELLGYPTEGDGLLVSGGNMANLVGLTAARAAKTPWDVRASGLQGQQHPLCVYASTEAHTWLQTAVDMLGMGTDAFRWISTDADLRMNTSELQRRIRADREEGVQSIAVVGTADTVNTGAVDPLPEIAGICREHDLWFHVDGAYGGLAVAAPEAPADLHSLREADSVAVDPHKWLYAPLEAGCVLVRDPHALLNAFSYHSPYYHFEDAVGDSEINYYEHGPQNSRGFRALKIWLALQQAGRNGYAAMIGDDMSLARALYRQVSDHPLLEPFTQSLSITTFRYVPEDFETGTEQAEDYLNVLNEALLT